MSISNFSLVNQKLAFAKSLCALAREISSVSMISAQQLRQDALLSSCALQLSLAFHFYLREIADRVYVKNSGVINSLYELELSLAQNDKSPSDVVELRDLAQQSGSWLEQLLRCSSISLQSPRKEKEKKSFQSDNLILAVEITVIDEHQPLLLTVDIIESWLKDFRELVLRHRDTSAEF
jgi:hypothetical protein